MREYLTFSIIAPENPYKDRVCEVISRNNIGGLVKKTGVVFGL
jgi:hypothetical protein